MCTVLLVIYFTMFFFVISGKIYILQDLYSTTPYHYIIYGNQHLGCFLSSKIFPTSCYSLPDVTDFSEIGVYHPPGVWVLAPISFQPTIDNIKWITKRVHDFICMSYFEYFLYYGDTISNASTK